MSTNQKLSSGVLGGWRVSTKGETRARRTTTSCSNTNYPYIMLYCKPQATLCTPDHPFLLPPSTPLPSCKHLLPMARCSFVSSPTYTRPSIGFPISSLARSSLVREERRSSLWKKPELGEIPWDFPSKCYETFSLVPDERGNREGNGKIGKLQNVLVDGKNLKSASSVLANTANTY